MPLANPKIILKELMAEMRSIGLTFPPPHEDLEAIAESAITKMMENGFVFNNETIELIACGDTFDTLTLCLPYGGYRILTRALNRIQNWHLSWPASMYPRLYATC